MEKLVWHTEQRKINDLLPFEHNPRKMSAKQVADLQASLDRFNLVEIPAINLDNMICAGHQRMRLMQLVGRGEELTDVRVPNRMMTPDEFKEYNYRSNKNTGSFDNDLLANEDEEFLRLCGWVDDEIALLRGDADFDPTDGSDSSRLDQSNAKGKIICPKCGHEFVPTH